MPCFLARALRYVLPPLILLLSLNLNGSKGLPRCTSDYTEAECEGSLLLEDVLLQNMQHVKLALLHARQQLLPPAPTDHKHLQEWLQAADYAATALVMLSRALHLEDDSVSIGRCLHKMWTLRPCGRACRYVQCRD
jgi:hypothetical protein